MSKPKRPKSYTGTMYLPLDATSAIDEFYPLKNGEPRIYMPLVVIYNTRQLAREIAQALKDSTSDGGKGNDDGNNTPK